MLAAIATPFSAAGDDDEDVVLTEAVFDANARVVAGAIVGVVINFVLQMVAVAVTVLVTIFVTLGDVEPDVRLYITNPASTEKGAALPSVGI